MGFFFHYATSPDTIFASLGVLFTTSHIGSKRHAYLIGNKKGKKQVVFSTAITVYEDPWITNGNHRQFDRWIPTITMVCRQVSLFKINM